jgi:hypothetical protein
MSVWPLWGGVGLPRKSRSETGCALHAPDHDHDHDYDYDHARTAVAAATPRRCDLGGALRRRGRRRLAVGHIAGARRDNPRSNQRTRWPSEMDLKAARSANSVGH